MRERFLNEGLDSFEDHQVLELLLFQTVPRIDTNPLAHQLMQRFGSLSAVLEADPKDLAAVEGIGKNAAAFLALIPQVTRPNFLDRVRHSRKTLNTSEAAAEYFAPLVYTWLTTSSWLVSRSFAPWISDVRKTGCDFHSVFLWFLNDDFAVAQVAERVRMGGHNVPEAVIRRRYGAGLRNFFQL